MKLFSGKKILSKVGADPVTNFMDEGKFFRIITELPGIPEEKIVVDLEKSMLLISVSETGPGKKYKKLIELPFDVILDKKKFQNGILDLTLEKTSPG